MLAIVESKEPDCTNLRVVQRRQELHNLGLGTGDLVVTKWVSLNQMSLLGEASIKGSLGENCITVVDFIVVSDEAYQALNTSS